MDDPLPLVSRDDIRAHGARRGRTYRQTASESVRIYPYTESHAYTDETYLLTRRNLLLRTLLFNFFPC